MDSDFTPELILRAYASGIFPMGDDDGTIRWYSPDPRCVIELDGFHAGRRLLRTYRKSQFEIRVDSDWEEVIWSCADRANTWINSGIVDAYTKLHELGFAHSVEAYYQGTLVGGLYGVSIGGAFMGESMFHRARDASKVCLVHLVERLKERGYKLLDCQYMNEHLRQFGATMIPAPEYLRRLSECLDLPCRFN